METATSDLHSIDSTNFNSEQINDIMKYDVTSIGS